MDPAYLKAWLQRPEVHVLSECESVNVCYWISVLALAGADGLVDKLKARRERLRANRENLSFEWPYDTLRHLVIVMGNSWGGIRPPRPPNKSAWRPPKILDLHLISNAKPLFGRPPGRLIEGGLGGPMPPQELPITVIRCFRVWEERVVASDHQDV